MRGGLVEVKLGGYVAVLDQGVVQVTVEASPHGGHVFQLGKMPHRDLLLAVTWALRCSHLQLDTHQLNCAVNSGRKLEVLGAPAAL